VTGSTGALPTPEQRAELVEEVAREASMPDGMLPGSAMLFFDPVLRRVFGGENAPGRAILADDLGIEQLIDRLEELDEDLSWDA
jgi:hypothetical protein